MLHIYKAMINQGASNFTPGTYTVWDPSQVEMLNTVMTNYKNWAQISFSEILIQKWKTYLQSQFSVRQWKFPSMLKFIKLLPQGFEVGIGVWALGVIQSALF